MNFLLAKSQKFLMKYVDPSYFLMLGFIRIAVLLFCLFTFANAQETPPLINYPLSVYKAHNQNWAIGQSYDHYIYSANSDGLLEYDGASWKLYPLPNHQIVRSVLCDEIAIESQILGKFSKNSQKTESRIYVGGFAEFGYWSKATDGQLVYHSLSKDAGFASLKTEEIWHILKTPKHIYFQSFSRIYRFDGRKLEEIKTPGNFMFLRYVRNKLLIQFIGKGLFELKNKDFVPVPGTENLAPTIVSSILPIPGNQILITTSKHGLFLWKNDTMIPWEIGLSNELKRNIINKAIVLSPDSSLVFGTIQKGIYVISNNGTLKYQFNKENGLQNNTVLALAEDSRKHLWVGLDQGIALIKYSSPFISYQTNNNPLGTTYTATIWRGNLYVGSNNGVFVKKWLSSESFRAIPGLEGQTWNLKVMNDQLLCGHNDATFRIESDGIKRISEITGGWVFLPVKVGNDSLLLQGAYNGLHVYKRDKQNLWAYAYPVKGIPPIPIRQIVQDRDGSFWLRHAYKGLYHTKLSSTLDSMLQWKEYKTPGDIPSEFSTEITQWKNNTYIRSSNQFLKSNVDYRLNPTKDFGDTSDDQFKVRTGIDDEWFKIWPNRIELHSPDKNVKNFELALITDYETIIPLTSQYYLFCLSNGYALYDRSITEKYAVSSSSPHIRKIANLRNPSEIFSIQSGLKLPTEARSIRIMYALPVYGHNIQYKHRLKELSEQWSEWTDQNFVEYTNLESQDYTFEIKSTLNNEVTTFSFSIAPYWRETFWAKFLLAIIIALGLLGLLMYQERRLVRHRKKLLDEQEEKIRQERLSGERRIMEIQNEKLQSEIKSKSQQISNVAINVVRKNEILEEIRDELRQVKQEMGQQLPNIHYQKLLHSIERNVAGKEDWVLFEENFSEVHEQFFTRLRVICPTISPSELRLAACLRMNLSTKEMAPALGISVRGVEIKRYRLRKKLGLDLDNNLVQFMMDI